MKFQDLNLRYLDYTRKECSEHHFLSVYSVSYGRPGYFTSIMPLDCSEVKMQIIRQLYEEALWGSPNTANRNLRILKANLNFGVREGYIEQNPIDKMAYFRQPKTPKYVPPPEHVEIIAKDLPPNYRDIYNGYRYTGARSSELRRLTWENVNLTENELILYTRKKRDKSWTGQPVTIVPELLEILKRRQGRSRYVFGEDEKPPVEGLNRWIRKICEERRLPPFTTHALRHHAAHKMAERGASTELIQRILRHQDIKTTQRYLVGLRTAHEAGQFLSDELYKKTS